MEIYLIIVAILIIIISAIIYSKNQNKKEKEAYNNGICRKCSKPWIEHSKYLKEEDSIEYRLFLCTYKENTHPTEYHPPMWDDREISDLTWELDPLLDEEKEELKDFFEEANEGWEFAEDILDSLDQAVIIKGYLNRIKEYDPNEFKYTIWVLKGDNYY